MEEKGPCPKYFVGICAFNVYEILDSTEEYFCALLPVLDSEGFFWIYTLQIFIPTAVHNPCILIAEQINNLFCSTDALTASTL